MNELIAKSKGAVKQVASALKGQWGIYATLAKEHGEVSSLLKQALKASSDLERESLIAKIRVELLSHTNAEEHSVYQRLARLDGTSDRIERSKAEHDEIERLLEEVSELETRSSEQTEALEALREAVENHVYDEENKLFPRAQRVFTDEQERALDDEFKRLKKAEVQRLSRSLPRDSD